ncbi:MAG: ABC transporter permease subunit [Verrucomicrobiota bacterium]|nr:ABC transporter permease subunit [Verrucomicrobiota bacterium]
MSLFGAQFLRRLFSFPLVGKELQELASNRRTYINRVIFVSLSIILFLIVSGKSLMAGSISALGRGSNFYGSILFMQFAYVYLVVPIIVSGVITVEKERDSLPLLFLTDLRGGEIIFEKYLSRMLPVVFLLMSFLPIIIMTYLMGGITVEQIIESQWAVFMALLLNAAIAVFCSSYFSSSVESMVSSLILTLLTPFSPILLELAFDVNFINEEYTLLLLPVFRALASTFGGFSLPWYYSSIAVGIMSIVYLIGARFFLYRRASAQSRSPLIEILRFVHRLLDSLVNKVLRRKATQNESLPGDRPIVWKEWARCSAFAPRSLTKLAIFGGLVALTIATFGLVDNDNDDGDVILVWFGSWAVYLVLIFALSINLIATEKKKQSLDVLLTTPITRKDIFKEKFRSLLMLNNICGLVVIVSSIFLCILRNVSCSDFNLILFEVVLNSLLAALIYPRLIMLVGVLSSCIAKSAHKATILAVTILIGWIVGSSILWFFLEEFVGISGSDVENFSFCIIPGPLMLKSFTYNPPFQPELVVIHFGLYGGIMGFLYYYIYRHADRLLTRGSNGS